MAAVLALGLDPAAAGVAVPGLSPDLVKAFIDAELQRLRGPGHEVVACLVDIGDTAEAVPRWV
ncbi:hypothetical protein [Ramlibacter alkalitolerans]|uniref:Uncharacterized protein n=1 Tax=Ramlibacter alkalitolerans TaxID=2039631 RepID=A0ABS1JX09_9BURK|nr:hypothetical protein [Ramlibacter alkalitolerans]MBL0428636.1 hypothetical protein [Ramlibacter alkalitolerans]